MCATQPLLWQQDLLTTRQVAQRARAGDMAALFSALNDRRPRVARRACKLLIDRHVVPRDRVWRLLVTTPWPHTRRRAVQLLARGDRSDSMVWLLCAVVLNEETVRDEAARHLADWARFWPPLATGQLAELTGALRRATPVLPQRLADDLWAYITAADGKAPPHPDPSAPTSDWAQRVLRRTYELPPRWRFLWR